MSNRAPVHRTIQICSIYIQGICPNNSARLRIHVPRCHVPSFTKARAQALSQHVDSSMQHKRGTSGAQYRSSARKYLYKTCTPQQSYPRAQITCTKWKYSDHTLQLQTAKSLKISLQHRIQRPKIAFNLPKDTWNDTRCGEND